MNLPILISFVGVFFSLTGDDVGRAWCHSGDCRDGVFRQVCLSLRVGLEHRPLLRSYVQCHGPRCCSSANEGMLFRVLMARCISISYRGRDTNSSLSHAQVSPNSKYIPIIDAHSCSIIAVPFSMGNRGAPGFASVPEPRSPYTTSGGVFASRVLLYLERFLGTDRNCVCSIHTAVYP